MWIGRLGGSSAGVGGARGSNGGGSAAPGRLVDGRRVDVRPLAARRLDAARLAGRGVIARVAHASASGAGRGRLGAGRAAVASTRPSPFGGQSRRRTAASRRRSPTTGAAPASPVAGERDQRREQPCSGHDAGARCSTREPPRVPAPRRPRARARSELRAAGVRRAGTAGQEAHVVPRVRGAGAIADAAAAPAPRSAGGWRRGLLEAEGARPELMQRPRLAVAIADRPRGLQADVEDRPPCVPHPGAGGDRVARARQPHDVGVRRAAGPSAAARRSGRGRRAVARRRARRALRAR